MLCPRLMMQFNPVTVNNPKVKKILSDLLNGREEIMDNPEPLIFVHNLSESSVDFRVLFWAADINTWLSLKSNVLTDIYTTFAKEGIEIPFPQQDVNLKISDKQAEIINNNKKPAGEAAEVTNTDITDTTPGPPIAE